MLWLSKKYILGHTRKVLLQGFYRFLSLFVGGIEGEGEIRTVTKGDVNFRVYGMVSVCSGDWWKDKEGRCFMSSRRSGDLNDKKDRGIELF